MGRRSSRISSYLRRVALLIAATTTVVVGCLESTNTGSGDGGTPDASTTKDGDVVDSPVNPSPDAADAATPYVDPCGDAGLNFRYDDAAVDAACTGYIGNFPIPGVGYSAPVDPAACGVLPYTASDAGRTECKPSCREFCAAANAAPPYTVITAGCEAAPDAAGFFRCLKHVM